MRRIFSNYLYPFAGLLVVLLIHAFTGESIHSFWGNIFIAVVFAFVGALLIGTFTFLYDTKWGPNKRIKILNRSTFKELQNAGFRKRDDFLWGIINGYTTVLSFTWETGKSAILVQVLFDPRKDAGHYLTLQELKAIAGRRRSATAWGENKYLWERNALGYHIEYSFIAPSPDKVLGIADELVGILQKENLKSITLAETEEMLPDMRRWISQHTEEQGFL